MKHNNVVDVCIRPQYHCSQWSDNILGINHSLYIKILIFIIFLGSLSCGLGGYFEIYASFIYKPHLSLQLMYLLGIVIGTCAASITIPFMGRRKPLILSIIPIYLVILLNCLFQGHHIFDIIIRFLAGISVGSYLTAALVYLGELSFQKYRPKNYAVLSFGYWLGLWIYLVCYQYHPYVSLVSLLFPTLFLIMALIYLPESPYFVMQINHPEFAAEILYFLRLGSLCRQEAEFMNIARYIFRSAGSYLGHFRRYSIVDRFVIIFLLSKFCSFSGFFLFIIVLRMIKPHNLHFFMDHGLTGVVALIAFLIYIFCVNNQKRFFFITLSFVGTLISVAFLNVYFLFFHNEIVFYMLVPIFFFFYFLGQASMPFLLIGEFFPHNMKPAAVGISISAYFILFSTGNFFNRQILIGTGPVVTCLFFTLQNIYAFLFAIFVVPKYQDYSLNEIQNYFEGMENIHVDKPSCVKPYQIQEAL